MEQAISMRRADATAPFRAVGGLARYLREVFGATFIVVVWAGLWLWAIHAVLAPWTPRTPAERTAVVESAVVDR